MKVIAIANQKGGVGKTTTTIELAACLANNGKKVIVIDFDQQGNTTDNLNASHEISIIDVFRENKTINEAIQHIGNIDIIASSEELSQVDFEFSSEKDRDNIYILADLCDAMKDNYDYILIDNTPARNTALNMAYVAADYVICPTEVDENSIKGIVNINKDIKKLRETRNHDSHAYIIGIILTKMERSSVHEYGLNVANSLAEQLEGDVFVETVRKSVRVSEIKTTKGSLQDYDTYCNPAVDYRRITNKIIEIAES